MQRTRPWLARRLLPVTAITNDYGTDEVFARQVRVHGRLGDVLLLISASGASPNVLVASKARQKLGLTVCPDRPRPEPAR